MSLLIEAILYGVSCAMQVYPVPTYIYYRFIRCLVRLYNLCSHLQAFHTTYPLWHVRCNGSHVRTGDHGMSSTTHLINWPTPFQHLVVNSLRVIDAFNISQSHPGSALTVLQDFPSFKNLFRSGVILSEIILGDIVLVRDTSRPFPVLWWFHALIDLSLLRCLGKQFSSHSFAFDNLTRNCR